MASGAATTPAPTLAPPEPQSVPAAPSREVITAPARSRTWRVAERDLEAPEGLLFRLALLGGPTPERYSDVLAWLVGTSERPVIGELWLFPVAGPPRHITSAPGFLPTGPTCTHAAELRWTGSDSVSLDINAECTAALLPRTAQRSVSLVAPWRDQPHVLGFQLAAPAPDERLDVQISSEDRDGDGRRDIEMSVALTFDGQATRARFVWFDRSAGLSRDASEPLASFRDLARLETERARSPKSSLGAAQRVAGARRLYASVCAESGTPRVFTEAGSGLECGALEEPLEALSRAAVQAALDSGRMDLALGALQQHRWFPAGSSDTERFVSRQLGPLLARVNERRVIKLVPLKARPRLLGGAPHLSPLSFHADGSLLLLTPDGLVRAAPDGRFEYEASAEVDPWPTVLASTAGEHLTGVAFPCDRSEVSWLRTGPDGMPLAPLPTSLVAPRPGNCGPRGAFAQPPIRLVAWSPTGVSAFVGAALEGTPPAHPPMGSAFSPNGRYGITATEWGLLVPGGDKPALWVFEDAGLPAQLHDCVISNNAQAAACILTGRAFVILPDPKSG